MPAKYRSTARSASRRSRSTSGGYTTTTSSQPLSRGSGRRTSSGLARDGPFSRGARGSRSARSHPTARTAGSRSGTATAPAAYNSVNIGAGGPSGGRTVAASATSSARAPSGSAASRVRWTPRASATGGGADRAARTCGGATTSGRRWTSRPSQATSARWSRPDSGSTTTRTRAASTAVRSGRSSAWTFSSGG